MTFAARECALKVLELSAGKFDLWDSTLAFAMAPNFISSGTAIYVLRSTENPATKYEVDLVEELRMQFPEATTMTVALTQTFPPNQLFFGMGYRCSLLPTTRPVI